MADTSQEQLLKELRDYIKKIKEWVAGIKNTVDALEFRLRKP